MKKFKDYMSEEPTPDEAFYVRVKGGKALLCSTNMVGPCSTFGREVASAVVQGDIVVTTSTRGETLLWRINRSSRNVIGPTKATS
jgi:hypothetical protein